MRLKVNFLPKELRECSFFYQIFGNSLRKENVAVLFSLRLRVIRLRLNVT